MPYRMTDPRMKQFFKAANWGNCCGLSMEIAVSLTFKYWSTEISDPVILTPFLSSMVSCWPIRVLKKEKNIMAECLVMRWWELAGGRERGGSAYSVILIVLVVFLYFTSYTAECVVSFYSKFISLFILHSTPLLSLSIHRKLWSFTHMETEQ